MIMPLLKDKHGDATKIDMYRGITLSCVVSKLFESVLVVLFEDSLNSDDFQFGLKKTVVVAMQLEADRKRIFFFGRKIKHTEKAISFSG